MSPRARRRGRLIPAFMACFYGGIAVGWLLHATFTPDAVDPSEPSAPVATSTNPTGAGDRDAATATAGTTIVSGPLADLRRRRLLVPIEGADIATLKQGFAERRDAGRRGHEAVDILAPRHTPIVAVEDGTVARLFTSRAGGTAIYQLNPTRRFCYYYAHLQRYADGLREGQAITKGQVLGYVGTTGNAPPNTPHLHFAIFELTDPRKWWQGTPLDPYEAFRIADRRPSG